MSPFHQKDIVFISRDYHKDLTNKSVEWQNTQSKEVETSFYSRRVVTKFAIDHSLYKFRNSHFALETLLRIENWFNSGTQSRSGFQ